GSLFSMGNNGNTSNPAPPPPPNLPASPLPMDDDYFHLDQPLRPTGQPASTNTIRLGDMLKPPPQPSSQSSGQTPVNGDNSEHGTAQVENPQPQQPAASTAPMGAPEDEVDPLQARQARLNALRQGK